MFLIEFATRRYDDEKQSQNYSQSNKLLTKLTRFSSLLCLRQTKDTIRTGLKWLPEQLFVAFLLSFVIEFLKLEIS